MTIRANISPLRLIPRILLPRDPMRNRSMMANQIDPRRTFLRLLSAGCLHQVQSEMTVQNPPG